VNRHITPYTVEANERNVPGQPPRMVEVPGLWQARYGDGPECGSDCPLVAAALAIGHVMDGEGA
jgi:hypothetical protein